MFPIELVDYDKRNDRKAQLEHSEKFCEGMFGVAWSFVKNVGNAEDVVQEAFIKAFEKIDQFKGEVTFGAWLKRIVVNQSIDFLKSRRQKAVRLENFQTIMVIDDDWSVANGITVNDFKSAIDKLPKIYNYAWWCIW